MVNPRLLKMAGFHLPPTGRFCPPADSVHRAGLERPVRARESRHHGDRGDAQAVIVETKITPTVRRLTPLRAIRKKCLWCCPGSSHKVRLCSITDCTLHPYRFRKRPKRPEANGRLTAMKAIRRNCLDCSACSPAEVRGCQIRDCMLHRYRMGKNPERQRKPTSNDLATPIPAPGDATVPDEVDRCRLAS